jgi:hypothetical protein
MINSIVLAEMKQYFLRWRQPSHSTEAKEIARIGLLEPFHNGRAFPKWNSENGSLAARSTRSHGIAKDTESAAYSASSLMSA